MFVRVALHGSSHVLDCIFSDGLGPPRIPPFNQLSRLVILPLLYFKSHI
jgi:hypothetical protein